MKRLIPLFLTIFVLALVACGGMAAESQSAPMEPAGADFYAEDAAFEMEEMAGAADFELAEEPAFQATPAATMVASSDGSQRNNQTTPTQRLIIKTGELELTVDDTAVAVDNTTDIILGAGGYIVSQRVWEIDGFKYASMQLGVPVAEFERTLTLMRRLGEVTVDVASGQDVTDEFVDLNSRLGNLQATQTRLREFLNEAENVEEILAVNAELSRVEEELEVIQGRINYLADRASFSTITVSFNPIIPTPTPRPTSTPQPWNPLEVAGEASEDLVNTTQDVVDFSVYTMIFCGPWLLIAAVVLFFLFRFGRAVYRRVRRNRPGRGQAQAAPPPAKGAASEDAEQ
ncbi:MAG: DUF4349 domain-containing protein [Anaerolineales bacterium]|nr:DUF4349 domain-containing protein [Anaerolineales bacterium]